jgi:hypothetical protein
MKVKEICVREVQWLVPCQVYWAKLWVATYKIKQ